jgi:transcriptional regulator with XRE-family HTH domain
VLDQKHLQTIASRVAELLRKERQRRQLSMSAVAERAGLSQQMVSYVERGLRNPTLDTLLRMAAAMKLDLAELLAAAQRKARKLH